MARILIVDDSTVMRKNLISIFNNNGHEVVGQGTNGKQAISLYSELKPDLVTMDISMPVMKGVDAVKCIMDLDPQAKIIMVSALNQKQMVFEALNNGAKHYIIKPIEANKILGIVKQVLEQQTEEDVEEEKKQSEEDSLKSGFRIENIQGEFVFYFNEYLGPKDYVAIETAIKGLLFISPLNIIFDFGKIKDLSEEVLKLLNPLKSKIIEAKGDFKCIAEDVNFCSKIHDLIK